MGKNIFITIAVLFITTLRTVAQSGPSTFDFVENKGQWDQRVRFLGELPTGAFFLEKKGYTVLLHNEKDLDRMLRRHHQDNPEGAPQPAARANARTATVHKLDGEGGGGPSTDNTVHSHAYKVEFLGASDDVEVAPDKELATYNNYFIGNDPSRWVSHARIFQAVVYKNIYPGIDLRYYSDKGQLKYDLIVNPGADVSKVALKYTGADKLHLRNGQLVVKTSVGDVTELSPYSFQFDKVNGRKDVLCNYQLGNDNTIRFKVASYSREATLIIDPNLIFSSFTGSRAAEWGFTATPGPDGSLFSGGIAFGQGFPTTPGAFQTNYSPGGSLSQQSGQGVDISICKFSPTGSARLYATYLGGNGDDFPHSLICDPQGNLIVLGRSYSGNSYPVKGDTSIVTTGPHGGCDIVITKFNASGSALIGSLRIGGTANDGVNIDDQAERPSTGANSLIRNYGDETRSEVILDAGGNIYIGSQTFSSDFPVTSGVLQGTLKGQQDGVVLKLTPDCQHILWSTYLGGSKNDGAFVLAINPLTGNLYVAGGTESTDFPGPSIGVIQPNYQGDIADGYIAEILPTGTAIIRRTFLGTNKIDLIYGIQFDKHGYPYVMGVTRGDWPVKNAAYVNAGAKQFIVKLKPDLSDIIYSTTFGTAGPNPNIAPVAFLVDRCENVYVSGWGGWKSGSSDPYSMGGTAGMPVTSDALKKVTDNYDFYFMVLKKDAAGLLYGSFFGQDGGFGEHVDGGTSRYDAQGVIYQAICANCFGSKAGRITTPFLTTPGVIGPVNGTGNTDCNLAAVKIAFNFAGVAGAVKAYVRGNLDTADCIPMEVTFRDTIRNAKSYIWNFGDGSPEMISTDYSVQHTYTQVGNYTVRLIAIDSSTCNERDTSYTHIRARQDRADLAMESHKLNPCELLQYRFDNLSQAPAGKPFQPNSFIWDFGDGTRIPSGPSSITHSFKGAGTYRVRLVLVDTNYCNAPDSVEKELRVSPLVKARFSTPATGCAPYTAVFNNTSMAGEQFNWDFGDGTTSTEVNPVHSYPTTGSFTIRLVVRDTTTCNKIDSTSQTIVVSPKPAADFNTTPVPPLSNTPTIFYNLAEGGTRFKWDFGDGDSTIKTTVDTVQHQYNISGSYHACLIAYNQFNCTDTVCKVVHAIVEPLLDVPNAFTPGRFGKNSYVRVEGFGIIKMKWQIFNRWGQKVFETADRHMGWDGTYRGQPQPMDVYTYTLDVEFSDGTKARKTGDITLIR